jgi:hypothetical protein
LALQKLPVKIQDKIIPALYIPFRYFVEDLFTGKIRLSGHASKEDVQTALQELALEIYRYQRLGLIKHAGQI